MAPIRFSVHFADRKYFFRTRLNETFLKIKSEIELLCGVDLSADSHVLEIYDKDNEEYVVFNQRYFLELAKELLHMSSPSVEVKLRTNGPNNDIKPQPTSRLNYAVVWLDRNIGSEAAYVSFKRDVIATIDVTRPLCRSHFDSIDLENLVLLPECSGRASVHFFDHAEDCMKFININSMTMKIFLVTSVDTMREICHQVINQVHAVYVLDFFIELNFEWLMDYGCDKILVYNFDKDLLVRLTRDVAEFCVRTGQEKLEVSDKNGAFTHFSHAKTLLDRVQLISFHRVDFLLQQVNRYLDQLSEKNPESLECQEI